jgi:catechol 2,3-dioxygenase-like lactoylglutathione lyase family enzyme
MRLQERHQLILTVSDIDRAQAFYSHLLGISGRRGSPGQNEPGGKE